MDELTFKLITRKGFFEAFYAELRRRRAAGQKVTERQIYEELNNRRAQKIGEPLFNSYPAFIYHRTKTLIETED